MIIGFCGQKGSGKDTAGAYLVDHWNFKRISFAQKLKDSAAACFGFKANMWEILKNDKDAKIAVTNSNMGWSVTAREFLQRYGTEAHRDIFGYNFWVDQALDKIDPDIDYVVTDVRFENEAIAIHERRGVVIQIVRDGSVKDDHVSEAGIPESLIDGKVANNGSKEQFYVLLDTLMERVRSGN